MTSSTVIDGTKVISEKSSRENIIDLLDGIV